MKVCSKCKKLKELVNFYKNIKSKDKHSSYCKECYISINKKWCDNNKERVKKLQKNRNKEIAKEYQKQHYRTNKEITKVNSKEYYKQNKDKIKEYYRKNRDTINKKNNEWQKKRRINDPLFRLRNNINNSINNAFKRSGYSKKAKIATIIGCDFTQLKAHLIMTFEINYCIEWCDNYLPYVSIDHIYSTSKAVSEQHLIELNHYSNLQYLFKPYNKNKSNNTDFIF